MFAEHVLLNHGNTFPFATRLNTVSVMGGVCRDLGNNLDYVQRPLYVHRV